VIRLLLPLVTIFCVCSAVAWSLAMLDLVE
jgi:hypothetical protein